MLIDECEREEHSLRFGRATERRKGERKWMEGRGRTPR